MALYKCSALYVSHELKNLKKPTPYKDITMWLVTINDNKMNVVLSNHLLSSLKIRLSERRDWERAKVKA